MQFSEKKMSKPLGLMGLLALTGVVHADPKIISTFAQIQQATTAAKNAAVTPKASTAASATAYTFPNGFNFNCDTAKFTTDAIENGRRAFMRLNCNVCHSSNGHGGTMGPSLVGKGDDVAEAVPNGEDNGMPAFKKYLCPTDLADLKAYINTLKSKSAPDFTDWWVAHPPAPFVDSMP